VLVDALLVLALGVATWWLLRDDGSVGDATALRPAAPAAGAAPSLPAPLDASSGRDAAPSPSTLVAPERAQPAALPTPTSLALRVLHAHGPAAGGGRVVVLSRDDVLLAQGALDDDGLWEHAGFDAPVEVYVLGLSPEPGRLSLDVGRGEHELLLPAGAWIAGHVTVNGAPPGRRLPVRLTQVSRTRDLPEGVDGVLPLHAEAPFAHERGALLSDPGGRFLVSGFANGAEVELDGPSSEYTRDVENSTPQPVHAPHDDVLLALRRDPVVFGRVVHADGTPAGEATLDYEFSWARPGAYGDPELRVYARAAGSDFPIRSDGSFSLALEDQGEGQCLDSNGTQVDSSACAPPQLSVDLRARHASAGSAHFETSGRDPRRDVDAGTLVLQPSQVLRLRVVDTNGAPIKGAKVEVGSSDDIKRFLIAANVASDADGRLAIPFEDVDLGYVFVGAEAHETRYVVLPPEPPATPLDVTLTADTALLLRVTWPTAWEGEPPPQWYVDVIGVPPLFVDAELPHGREGLEQWGPRALGAFPQTPIPPRAMQAAELQLELRQRDGHGRVGGLRAHTPMHLRLHAHSRSAEFRAAETAVSEASSALEDDVTYWESDALWLEPGEQRVIDVDLSTWTEP